MNQKVGSVGKVTDRLAPAGEISTKRRMSQGYIIQAERSHATARKHTLGFTESARTMHEGRPHMRYRNADSSPEARNRPTVGRSIQCAPAY
jgi:hypothetical protein